MRHLSDLSRYRSFSAQSYGVLAALIVLLVAGSTNPCPAQVIVDYTQHTSSVRSVAWTGDGAGVVSFCLDRLAVWEAKSGKELLTLGRVYWADISADGKVLAVALSRNTLQLYDLDTTKPLGKPIVVPGDSLARITLSPDKQLIANGTFAHFVQIIDLKTGKVTELPKAHDDVRHASIQAIQFSPDGKMLAAGGRDGKVVLWDCRTWKVCWSASEKIASFPEITRLGFSPDSSKLVYVDRVGHFYVLNTKDGSVVVTYREARKVMHDFGVRGAAFSPDSKLLALCGMGQRWEPFPPVIGGKVQLWDFTRNQTQEVLMSDKTKGDLLFDHLAFSPDGGRIAVASTKHVKILKVPEPR